MKAFYTLLLLVSLSNFTVAADYFWISGTGNWNDPLHWSATSGGPAGVTLPTLGDNVLFDNNSGILSTLDTVYINTNVLVSTLDFSAVSNAFVFHSTAVNLFELRGSLLGNASGVSFSGIWGEINLNAQLTGESIGSGGTTWVQDFRVTGEQINLLDDFDNGSSRFFIDLGGVDLGGNTFSTFEFHSAVGSIRSISLLNSTVNITGGFWEVDSLNLSWTSSGSVLLLGDNATLAEFHGGGLSYDTLRSQSATQLAYFENNQFSLFQIPTSSQLNINSGDSLSTDSLIVDGTCFAPTEIFASTPGLSAAIVKTGTPELLASGVLLTDIDAGTMGNYTLRNSDTLASTGWIVGGGPMYWIGDGGNWTDPTHWSYASGGSPSGCVPTEIDSVFFDVNSFSLVGQTVVVNDFAFFKAMDWTGSLGNQTLRLDSVATSYGDLTFTPNLTMVRNSESASISIFSQSELSANSATIDCAFAVLMIDPSDSLLIMDDLIMSDSSSIVLFNGELYTQNNTVVMGTLKSFNNDLSGADLRKLDLGGSMIELKVRFDAQGDTTLVFDAGTSHLLIGDTLGYSNDLISLGLNFYDVTLNFQLVDNQQVIRGDNQFHELTILPGSAVHLEANATQTIVDSLVIRGNCENRIYIGSTDTSIVAALANLEKLTTSSNYIGENVTLQQINASGLPLTLLFSTDAGDNLNWTFDASLPVSADYTVSGSFCFGDTVDLANNSTVYTGGSSAMSSIWYFNDGSTGYYLNPPVDSTFITYEADTNQHVFTNGGDFTVLLEVTNLLNQCVDTMSQIIHINRAEVFLTTTEYDTTICVGDSVIFEASSFIPGTTFEYFINGLSQNVPSSNDTLLATTSLANLDVVGVLSFENGCVSDTMPMFQYVVNPLPIFNFTSSDPDQVICYTDSVSFTAYQPSDSSYSYQFLLNGIGVTSYLDSFNYYVNDSLVHNDTLLAVGLSTLGCYDTLSMIFTVNDLPTTSLTSSVVGTVICDGDPVTFTASGAVNYEFYVNGFSVQGPSASDTYFSNTLTASDTITVRGINLAGCEKMAPEIYYYIVSPIPSTTMTISDLDSSICSGNLVTFTGNGAPIYEFFVNGVSAQFGAASEYITDSLNNGDLIVVAGHIGACSSPAGAVLMEVLLSPPTVLTNSDGDNTICYGTPVTFTGSGATNYEFFVDGISVQGPSPLSTYSTSALLNGQIVQLDGESNTCIVSESDNFTVLNNPIVNFFSNDLDNTICAGGAIQFVAANAGTYEFFVGGTSVQGPSVVTSLINPTLSIGSNPVVVVGTAGNGCTDTSAVISITVHPIPTVSLVSSDPNNTICAGDAVTFSGSGAAFYQFFIGSTAQGALSSTSTFTTSGLSNGQAVTVFGSTLGCSSTSNLITTTVNAVPTVSISSTDVNNTFCSNELVNYTANGALNYEFFVNGISQGASSASNSLNSSGFPTGSFPLSVTGESNGCMNSASATVVVNPTPNASIISSDVDNTICSGDVLTYSGSGGAVYQFAINGIAQGSASPASTFTLNSLSNTDVLSVTAYSAQGCSNTATMPPIVVNPTPVISLSSSELDFALCIGDNVNFTASGATDYEFFVNSTSQGVASSASVFSTNSLSNGATVYVVGTSLNCPASSSAIGFTVYNYPIVSFANLDDTILCNFEPSNLQASGADNYQFTLNASPFGISGPGSTFTSPLLNGSVVGVIGTTNGCSTVSNDDYTFIVYPYPVISTSSSAGPTICLNDQVDFTASGALTYAYSLNGIEVQSGTTSTFGTNTVENGDVITITGYNDVCNSAPSSYSFVVNSMNLELAVSPSTMVCAGDLVTFTATGGDLYSFSLNGISQGALSATSTFASTTLNDLDEVTFSAFSNATSCAQDYSTYAILNVIDAPSIAPMSATTFCAGDSVVLTSNATYGNQWFLDGLPIAGATDTTFTALESGAYTLETTAGGTGDLWSFGYNANGTFGDATNFNNAVPTPSLTAPFFDELSSGANFVLAVTTSGQVYSWGENTAGQLGDGTYVSTNAPHLVPSLANIKTIATSAQSSMAVTNTGSAYVWGINSDGQLSTGSTAVINFPFLNASLTNVDSIAGGKTHFVLLKNDGTVWTVGNNSQGQLGHGNLTPLFSAVQVPGLSNIASVGAGEYSSFAVSTSGDLYVWGSNGSGQLGLNDLTNRLSPVLSPLMDVRNVQGGANHTLILTEEGEVLTTGANNFGQLGTGDFLPRLTPTSISMSGGSDISAGQYTSLVLRDDRSVFGFGNNAENQLTASSNSAISTPEHLSMLDGVDFVEAGRLTSHVLYNEAKVCASPAVSVDAMIVPTVSISAMGALLTTIAGTSYQWYFDGSIIPGATDQSYLANETGDFSVEVSFANGCVGVSNPFPMSFVSLTDLSEVVLRIYPNPASHVLNIEIGNSLDGALKIEILDAAGRLVDQQKVSNVGTTSIDISTLETGMYQLIISSDTGRAMVRFVKAG